MSATGLEVFDRTLHSTNAWLRSIMEDLGPDRRVAYRAMRAVLHALRDRLTVDEAAHLAAQLPLLVKGIFFDGWHPAGKPEKIRSSEDFLARVAGELHDMRPIDAEQATRAVLKALSLHVSEAEIAKMRHTLPAEIRRLWPEKEIAAAREEPQVAAPSQPAPTAS